MNVRRSAGSGRKYPHHLEFIRSLPCLTCGKFPPCQAAHIRCGTDGGIGLKPSDRYAVPLCSACHARQHQLGERSFWQSVGIEPHPYAAVLWLCSGFSETGQRIVRKALYPVRQRPRGDKLRFRWPDPWA